MLNSMHGKGGADGRLDDWKRRPFRGTAVARRKSRLVLATQARSDVDRERRLFIPFGLLWGGFAVFWEWNVLRMPNAPVVMIVFGAPFVLIGLFMIFGRFFVDAWLRQSVFYALTDRRVLILRSRPSVSFQSISLDRLPEATVNESSDGSGTIRFGPAALLWNSRSAGGFGAWMPTLDPTPQFIAIGDVRKVFTSISGARATGRVMKQLTSLADAGGSAVIAAGEFGSAR